jgi:hypothetical protein
MTLADAEEVINEPVWTGVDETGRRKYYGPVREVTVCIVVALDDPDPIVTIHERRS